MTELLKIVPYEAAHLELLDLRAEQTAEKPKEIQGSAVTVLHRSNPVAILGGFHLTPNVIQLWGLISDSVSHCKVSFHKTIREFLVFMAEHEDVSRFQMSVHWDHNKAKRWAESLGFRCEGRMDGYGPKREPYLLYGRAER